MLLELEGAPAAFGFDEAGGEEAPRLLVLPEDESRLDVADEAGLRLRRHAAEPFDLGDPALVSGILGGESICTADLALVLGHKSCVETAILEVCRAVLS